MLRPRRLQEAADAFMDDTVETKRAEYEVDPRRSSAIPERKQPPVTPYDLAELLEAESYLHLDCTVPPGMVVDDEAARLSGKPVYIVKVYILGPKLGETPGTGLQAIVGVEKDYIAALGCFKCTLQP